MNSFLQQLYMIPNIRRSFLAIEGVESDFIKVAIDVLLFAFKRLMTRGLGAAATVS